MALSEEEEIELELLQLRKQKAAALSAQPAQPRPSVDDLYAQEQEAINNAPYISPEMNAQIDASLAASLKAPAAPAPAPALSEEPSPDWSKLTNTPNDFQGGPFAGIGKAATSLVKGGIGKLQEKYGRPIAQTAYDFVDFVEQSPIGSGESITGTRTEPLARAVLSPIGGEDFQKGSAAGEEALKKDVARIPGVGADKGGYGLEPLSPSPETAAALFKGIGQSLGPAALIGNLSEGVTKKALPKLVTSATPWIAANAPMLAKLLGYATEGFAGGFTEGLLMKSQDPLTSGLVGAAGDVALRGVGGELVGATARKGKALLKGKASAAASALEPQVVGVITPEAKKQVVDEAFAAASGPAPVTKVDEAGVDAAVRYPPLPGRQPDAPTPLEVVAATPTPATVKATDIEAPFAARVRLDAEGNPVLSVLEVKRGQVPRAADMPIGTHTERSKAFAYMWRKKLPIADMDRNVLANPKVELFFEEMKTHTEDFLRQRADTSPASEVDEFFAKRHPKELGKASVYDPKLDRYVEVSATSSKGPPPPDPDAPVGPPRESTQPLLIQEHPDGALSLSRDDVPTNPGRTPPQLTRKNPDSISVGGRGGRTPPQNKNNLGGPIAAAAEPPPPRPPNGGGPPPPPPTPPPPGPGDIPPHQLQSVQTVLGAAEKMSRQPGLWERTIRSLVGAHHRGPKDAGELILMQRGSAVLEQTFKDVYNSLRRLIPKKDRIGFEKEFARYAAGEANSHVLQQKYPKAWAQVEELANRFLQERDANQAELIKLGFLPDELGPLIESGTMDKYMARSYLSYVLPPGDWAKHVRKHRMDLVADAAAHYLNKLPGWSESDIAAKITTILHAQDPLDAFAGSPLNRKGKAANALLKREDIPKEIRALLGEVESGTFKLAMSLGNQRANLANARMWTEIVANPQMFSKSPVAGVHHPEPLPDSPRHYGPAAGGYVTPHLYEALVNVPKAIESGPQWLRSLMGFTKGNEVALGGAGPWLNATVGNAFWYSPLAGGISPTNPGHMGKYLIKAMRELYAYFKNPTGENWVMSAKRYGTDASGVGGLEIDPNSNPAAELFGDMLNSDRPMNGPDVIAAWGKRIGHDLKGGYGSVGRKYDLVDRTFKLANFMAIVDRLVAQGWDIHSAMKHASYRINQSFPSPDKMGAIPTRISRGWPGLFAKYGTFFMEDLRVNAMLPKRLLEEPDLRWRLLGMTALMGGLFGYNSLNRYWAGITQDEIDKAEAKMSDGQKYHRPLTFVAGWRNSKGQPMMWDLTQFVPLARLLQGHPDDAAFRRILANLITGGFDSGVAENEVTNVLVRSGLIRPVRQPSDMMPGEDRTLQALQMAWDFGLAPKAPERVYEALRKAETFGPVGPATDTYTQGEAVAKSLGWPALPSPGQGSENASTFEFSAAEKQFRSDLARAGSKPPEQALPFLQQMYRALVYDTKDAHKEAKIKAIHEAFIRETKRMEERQRILGGSK